MVAKTKKQAYFAHLEECLKTYKRAFIVHADFVGSKQISDIRIALRGKAELVFGKNTMVRRCLRNMCAAAEAAGDPHPEWMAIVDVMKGNLGFMFTNGELDDLDKVVKEFVKPAAAKAGVIAPCDCFIPKGPTGLDPAQTSFFQALNIATKINKGTIEIINDTKVLTEGIKVGSSEAALLVKMNVRPFEYGLVVHYVYEGGVFDPSVLKITESVLLAKFMEGVGSVAALSLATAIPTAASFPHLVINAVKDITAVAIEAEFYEFDAAKRVKEFLDDPKAWCAKCGGGGGGAAPAAAAPAAGGGGAAAAKAPEPEEEEEEEDVGFDLFD